MSRGVRLSLVMVGGTAAGVIFPVEWLAAFATSIAAVGMAPACNGGHRRAGLVCLWVAALAVALAHGAHAREAALIAPPDWVTDSAGPVQIEGRLVRDAAMGESGVRLALADVMVSDVAGHRVPLPHLDVLAIVAGTMAEAALEDWNAGHRVRMPARLRIPAVVRNPGSPSVRWQQLTRPFDLLAVVKSASLVDVEPGGFVASAAASVRRYVRHVARVWLAPRDEQTAAVVTAILIGDRAGLDDEVTQRLQAAGTFHVIAISGGNVAILTAVCLFVLRLVTRREWVPVLVTLLIVLAYGVVVGREASVARAVVAASIYLSLRLVGLAPRAINVLAITALVCVVVEPLMVLDVGAWLSFGATLGLITVLPRLMGEAPTRRLTRRGTVRHGAWHNMRQGGRGLALATVAAEIVILPITASVFMRVGVAGLVLNFVAIPAMTVVQLAGVAVCLAAPWWTGAALMATAAAHAATRVLTGSAALVDMAPWLSWRVPPPPLLVALSYYAAVVVAMAWTGRRRVHRGAVALAMILAVAVTTAPWTHWSRPAPGWMRVTMIDVGQGEAVAVQLPSGQAFLVDAGGSMAGFDVGGRIVTPALWALGIRRLDWLAITHGDVDHAGGAARVAQEFRPAEVWEGVPVPPHVLMNDLRRATADTVWRRLNTGHQLDAAGVVIDVLHPPIPEWERRRVRNDDSLVLRLRYDRVEVLLTGDAGSEFESRFARDPASPPIRVLKVAHHGSRTSTPLPFVDAYAPAAAVISAGQGNTFGHPAPAVVDRLGQRGVDVFRTDRDGAIVIETDGRVLRVRSLTGRELTVTSDVSPAAMPLPSLRE